IRPLTTKNPMPMRRQNFRRGWVSRGMIISASIPSRNAAARMGPTASSMVMVPPAEWFGGVDRPSSALISAIVRCTMKHLLASLVLLSSFAALAMAAPPRLEKHGDTQQLVVDGKPFLVLGGELGNSSASSAEYMKPHWPRLKAMHLNTVLAPVYWELIEPTQGKYDWSSLDAMLRDARAQDLKLMQMWFGD